VLFAMYLVLAGLERFIVEFWRRNNHVLGALTAAQLESLGLVVVGAIALFWTIQRHGTLRRDDQPARRIASREPAPV
jgi:phosphatidylglycerol:prolipoprotein diacylglycerol transferase